MTDDTRLLHERAIAKRPSRHVAAIDAALIRDLDAALSKAERDRDEHLRGKNELVLRTYRAEDCLDAVRKDLHAIVNMAHLAWTDAPHVREMFEMIEKRAIDSLTVNAVPEETHK